jgi:hypothetical protein
MTGDRYTPAMRAALDHLARGPFVRMAAGFVPAPDHLLQPSVTLQPQTVRALVERHAARFKRTRRHRQFAELTPRGRAIATWLSRDDEAAP